MPLHRAILDGILAGDEDAGGGRRQDADRRHGSRHPEARAR